jgi:hypothetical protein
MLRTIVTLALCAFTAVSARAESTGFKDMQLGAPLSGFTNSSRFACKDNVCTLREHTSIGGVDASEVRLQFYQDKLHLISVSFSNFDFGLVQKSLTSKFGAPRVDDHSKGYSSRRVEWDVPGALIIGIGINDFAHMNFWTKEYWRAGRAGDPGDL